MDQQGTKSVASEKSIGSQVKRSNRIRARRERRDELGGVALDTADLEAACFADWSEHNEECYYWSWLV